MTYLFVLCTGVCVKLCHRTGCMTYLFVLCTGVCQTVSHRTSCVTYLFCSVYRCVSNCEPQDKLCDLPILFCVQVCVSNCVIGQVVRPAQCVSVHQLGSEKTVENRKETGGK